MKTRSDFYALFSSRPAAAGSSDLNASLGAAKTATPTNARPSPRYRTRDFGTGYGRSSGYAVEAHYTADRDHALLRVC